MHAEYLLFDLAILSVPLALSLWPRLNLGRQARHLLWACLLIGLPFVLWDAAVAGRHWWFNDAYVLGIEVLGLPIEEILFFLAVPYACGFAWETIFKGRTARASSGLRWIHPLLAGAAVLGPVVFSFGLEYTGLALLAVGAVAVLDHALGTVVLRQPRFWAFAVVVAGLNLIFNGYLTSRPVVLYDESYQLGLRIFTIPVEDFVYGFALTTGVLMVFQWLQGRRFAPSWLARVIRARFRGYRHAIELVDGTLPKRAEQPREVAVIGGGLAGISAAMLLAERGMQVTLIERNPYLGGKVAGWTETLDDGWTAPIEHGFHAFFGHYYNLQAFLRRTGLDAVMRPIERYVILTADGRQFSFGDEQTVPVLNLLSLARAGLYSLREVAMGPAGSKLEQFLRYDETKTFERWDEVPFEDFARSAELPEDLRVVFNAFARAFFADDDRLSTAELIRSFHFYYLSHDRGLVYEYLDGNYARDFIAPLQRQLQDLGVKIRTDTAVRSLQRRGDALAVDGRLFDDVVLAADVAASRAILEGSPELAREDPSLLSKMAAMRAGQRYAVLRLWLDTKTGESLPVFVSTQRVGILDAVAYADRTDPECGAWARDHDGAVLELHCYSIPDEIPDAEVQAQLLAGLHHYFPELKTAKIHHRHLQLRNDFTALHVGMHHHRPEVQTGIEGLYLAGDWVKLPCPAMLMEAAHTSGLLAANAICRQAQVQTYPVFTVPTRGILAGIPERPS